jgi:hypothetical protein
MSSESFLHKATTHTAANPAGCPENADPGRCHIGREFRRQRDRELVSRLEIALTKEQTDVPKGDLGGVEEGHMATLYANNFKELTEL